MKTTVFQLDHAVLHARMNQEALRPVFMGIYFEE